MKRHKNILLAIGLLLCLTACNKQVVIIDKNEPVEAGKEITENEATVADSIENNSDEISEEKDDVNKDGWKDVYKKYLYDILADKESLSDGYTAFYYSEGPEKKAFFILQDVTGDDVPELWVTPFGLTSDTQYYGWFSLCTVGEDNNIKDFPFFASFYDSDKQELYGAECVLDEDFSVYKNENGKLTLEYMVLGNEKEQYRKGQDFDDCDPISLEEGQELDAEYDELKKKYGIKNAIELTPENIEKALSKEKTEANGEITDDQALLAIKNYCYENFPDLKDMVDSDKYTIYWYIESSDEKEIVVVYRSYTAALVRYYIDRATGATYVTEFAPGITEEEERTDESFSVGDYFVNG
ncbi:hypothetical protein [Butyrivibrio sp. LB2008]|uniref:hypothetical protein n=1 Tax=Butyrivibrio sp. LB2008 TaxID=1408305 RepID=UPI00047E0F5A|nr:hypothetical protein [Butyrivibrio sp. LB2008]